MGVEVSGLFIGGVIENKNFDAKRNVLKKNSKDNVEEKVSILH